MKLSRRLKDVLNSVVYFSEVIRQRPREAIAEETKKKIKDREEGELSVVR